MSLSNYYVILLIIANVSSLCAAVLSSAIYFAVDDGPIHTIMQVCSITFMIISAVLLAVDFYYL